MPRRAIVKAALPIAVVAALSAGCVDRRPDEATLSANDADRMFVDAMIAHHQTTILLARVATTRGSTQSVRRLAQRVVARRTAELDVLNTQEEAMDIAGVSRAPMTPLGATEDPGAGRRELTRLRRADAFDAAFIDAMRRHEQHDVEMSRLALERGRDPDVERTARRILRDRRTQLRAMRRFADPA